MLEGVDAFAVAMKEKLILKAFEGRHGGLDGSSRPNVAQSLEEHTQRAHGHAGQEVDIANLAMMLWVTRGGDRNREGRQA